MDHGLNFDNNMITQTKDEIICILFIYRKITLNQNIKFA
jgi:hypothetical protein